jgi:hypothetical protein
MPSHTSFNVFSIFSVNIFLRYFTGKTRWYNSNVLLCLLVIWSVILTFYFNNSIDHRGKPRRILLIKKKFNLDLSLSTVGRYLKKWGFTSQKPIKKAYEQDNTAVQKWLQEEYPFIKKRAKKEKAEIYWGDETGIRSDHQTGKSYGKKGETPVAIISAKRFRSNVVSAINNKGKLAFSVFEGKFTSKKFIEFLNRLIKHSKGKKTFLIVDNLSSHKSNDVQNFVQDNKSKITHNFFWILLYTS